jgi:hypothetical protein
MEDGSAALLIRLCPAHLPDGQKPSEGMFCEENADGLNGFIWKIGVDHGETIAELRGAVGENIRLEMTMTDADCFRFLPAVHVKEIYISPAVSCDCGTELV